MTGDLCPVCSVDRRTDRVRVVDRREVVGHVRHEHRARVLLSQEQPRALLVSWR